MIAKQQIDTLLSIVKPSNEQEKQLLACIQYELYKCVDDYELCKKHFENEIKKYKYYKSKPIIDKLEVKIKELEKENRKLTDENYGLKRYEEKFKEQVLETENAKLLLRHQRDFRQIVRVLKLIAKTYESDLWR